MPTQAFRAVCEASGERYRPSKFTAIAITKRVNVMRYSGSLRKIEGNREEYLFATNRIAMTITENTIAKIEASIVARVEKNVAASDAVTGGLSNAPQRPPVSAARIVTNRYRHSAVRYPYQSGK
jgi:hypothetical protein